MARIYFRNANKKKSDSAIPGPGKTVWKAAKLCDDVVHREVSTVADSLYKSSPRLSRRTLAFSMLTAGLVTSTLMSSSDDLKKLATTLFVNTGCLIAGKIVINWATDEDNDVNKFRHGLLDKLMRLMRVPALALGAIYLGLSAIALKFPEINMIDKIKILGHGISFTCVSISCYLISSSTGAYNEFREWVNRLRDNSDKKND